MEDLLTADNETDMFDGLDLASLEEASFAPEPTIGEELSQEEFALLNSDNPDDLAKLLASEPGPEVDDDGNPVPAAKEGEGGEEEGEAKEPNPLEVELEKLRARVAETDRERWSEEVLRRRAGDPEKGIEPDPLFGYPVEIQDAYKEAAAPMQEEISGALLEGAGMVYQKHLGPLMTNQSQAFLAMREAFADVDVSPGTQGEKVFAAVKAYVQDVQKSARGFYRECEEGFPVVGRTMAHKLGLATATATYQRISTAQHDAVNTQQAQAALESEVGEMKETLAKSGLSFSEEEEKEVFEEFGALRKKGLSVEEAMAIASKPLKAAFAGMIRGLEARGAASVKKSTKQAAALASVKGAAPSRNGARVPQSPSEVYALVNSGQMSPEAGIKHMDRIEAERSGRSRN